MTKDDAWSLSGAGPENYESHQVPTVFEPLAELFLDRIKPKPGQRVLDVACGTGIVSRLAAPIVGDHGQVVGLDFNQAMLEVASKNSSGAAATIRWLHGDAAALPCDAGSFDIALCQQGLQFFPDKVSALREMHRVLAPEGSVWLAVWRGPEYSPINLASNEVLGRYLGPDAEKVSRAPFSLGNADDLRSLLSNAGFQNVEIEATQIVRHMQPPEISIPAQLTSLPVGPQIAALQEETRSSIVADISAALSNYRTKTGMSVPQGTHIVSAGE